jgi:hypothetical protein
MPKGFGIQDKQMSHETLPGGQDAGKNGREVIRREDPGKRKFLVQWILLKRRKQNPMTWLDILPFP